MIFCSGSLTHFVTGIVSHFCNCYMLQLCWNHKFRGFHKVLEGFKRWRWFQISGFKFQVSDGFRWFQRVSEGFRRFQEGAVSDNDSDSNGQRFWLEASTFSNRGRSLRIADSQSAGWKPVPKHILCSLLTAHNPSQRPRLEAYTLSNRGRSLRIVNTVKTAGWKSVPIHIIAECLTFRLYFAYISPIFTLHLA